MQQLRAVCRRYQGWILLTVTLLLCQRWWMARGRPERLLELPEGYAFTRLHNGLLYVQKIEQISFQQSMTRIRRAGSSRAIPVMTNIKTPAAPALFTMPANGGPLHPVSPDSLEVVSPDALFTAGTDTYRVEYRKTTPGLAGIPPGYGRGNAVMGGGSGPVTPPPPPRPPFHTVVYREESEGVTATLRRVSGSGASAAKTITCPMGYIAKRAGATAEAMRTFFKSKIAFSGNAVYWLQGFPDETATRESANGQTVGVGVSTYRGALMTMPMQGGTPRKLLDALPENVKLLASEDGVLCWVGKQTRKEYRQDWLRVRPDGASQLALANFSSYDTLVECSHHLYWRQYESAADRTSTLKIMEANADGSGWRVLYTAVNASEADVYTWRGRVYFRVVDAPIPGQSDMVYKSTLYRVNPSVPSGVERLYALPDNMEQMLFDGDYAYCLAREEKTGLMETLHANASARPCRALYRCRLPAR